MRTDTAPTISRHDYRPYPYRLPHVTLRFDLEAEQTRVHTTLQFERASDTAKPLVLDGEDLHLESVSIDGVPLQPGDWTLTDETLTLFPEASGFTVEIVSLCKPAENSTLMGLYVSGESLFTQCEAQGFRRITWFPDRPDIMSRYTVALRAHPARYPQLLSNGNLTRTGVLADGRHEAVWEDPHPKPSYLFALVAGQFDCREQPLIRDGEPVAQLQVYSDKGTRAQTAWALDCLARAIAWDEQRFGLKLDLERFMIVAARDFNMGAMENKGLNIFNASYVLADPDTATDATYQAIESVIGHEYFHNWTGNRVTCRDWFQLSLKEGLTVFRDQEFSADMMAHGLDHEAARSARAIKRIDDVTALRMAQFPEDAGPMAHPVRPESYQEITNFYTATIYEKGAEVIRMQHTLLGEDGFQAGLAEYFRRHDGQAVTCDDFIDAMDSVYRAQNPGKSLDVFRRWYSQAGTPRVKVDLDYDEALHRCTITLTQRCEPAGIEKLAQPIAVKPPLHIPFALGLLDQQGQSLPVDFDGQSHETVVLELTDKQQTWHFDNIPQAPIPSLLRNFSAPVIVEYDRPDGELAVLARHDPDAFSRWEACQEIATGQILSIVKAIQSVEPPNINKKLFGVWTALLEDEQLTPAYRARVLAMPAEKVVLEKTAPMDPLAVTQAIRQLKAAIGESLADLWLTTYQSSQQALPEAYTPDTQSIGHRSLKNLALTYLMAGRHPQSEALALEQYYGASTMTDRTGALSALVSQVEMSEVTATALDHFYQQWQHNPQVIDRWFAIQATAPSTRPGLIRALMLHPAFTLRNPNRARALIFQFCQNNLQGIHRPEGYDFWAEQVLALDALNPEIAARLARTFDNWERYPEHNRSLIKQALERIQQQSDLSRNVSEIVSKALKIEWSQP